MAKENPKDCYYSKTHEWVRVDGEVCTCGITDHAQHALTDIVFVELPEIGAKASQGQRIAVVESVKSVSDIYAPLSGEVIEVNQELAAKPETINDDPYVKGWIFKIRSGNIKELSSLLKVADYEKLVREEAH